MLCKQVLLDSLVLLCSLAVAYADNGAEEFVYPGPSGPGSNYRANLDLQLGSDQVIQWISNISNAYTIALYQQDIVGDGGGAAVQTLCSGVNIINTTMSCAWHVQLYNSNLTFSPVYFFWHNPGFGIGKFTSHYFNITDSSTQTTSSVQPVTVTATNQPPQSVSSDVTLPSSSSSSATYSSLPSSVAASSTSSTTSASPASTAAASMTSEPAIATNTTKSDNTVALNVGLGVGLGVGIPLVLIAGILVGLKVVRQRRNSWNGGNDRSHPAFPGQSHPPVFQEYSQPAPQYYQHAQPQMFEAPTHQTGWGPNGEFEPASKTPRIAEIG